MTAPLPKRGTFEDMARELAARHVAWDVPHRFYALHFDPGTEQMSVGAEHSIGLDADPETMPDLLRRICYEHIESQGPAAAAICGWALGWEGYGVMNVGSMPEAEREQYRRDLSARRLYTRSDAVEVFQVTMVDLRGRAWLTLQRAGQSPAEASVDFCGTPMVAGDGGSIGGAFADALRVVGYATAHVLHGMPLPGGPVPGFLN